MKTLTIRGLPEEVHSLLKSRAKKNRRSLNQEVIAELTKVEEEQAKYERVGRLIAGAESVRRGIAEPLTKDEIADAIREGRR
jgi:plasmid stability protein